MIGSSTPGLRVGCSELDSLCVIGVLVLLGCGAPQGSEEHVGMTVDTSSSWPSPEVEAEAAARDADTIFRVRLLNFEASFIDGVKPKQRSQSPGAMKQRIDFMKNI